MITAELAQKIYSMKSNLDKGIMIAACQGKREYICKDILPLDVQKEYELNGYTITEDLFFGFNLFQKLNGSWR